MSQENEQMFHAMPIPKSVQVGARLPNGGKLLDFLNEVADGKIIKFAHIVRFALQEVYEQHSEDIQGLRMAIFEANTATDEDDETDKDHEDD